MQSSTEVERKIGSFRTIRDIIDAMKGYAGAAMRRTEDVVPPLREYERQVAAALNDIKHFYPDTGREGRQKGRRILVAFGSSQGLCGPYNEKMADAVSGALREGDTLFVMGTRLAAALTQRHIDLGGFSDSMITVSGIQEVLQETVEHMIYLYQNTDAIALVLLFTNIADGYAEIVVEQILPPTLELPGDNDRHEPLVYLSPAALYQRLLEEFLYISLYRCHVEALRSENWYRMRSMEGASANIDRKISELGILQKFVRQEEITEEMLEILGSGMFYGD